MLSFLLKGCMFAWINFLLSDYFQKSPYRRNTRYLAKVRQLYHAQYCLQIYRYSSVEIILIFVMVDSLRGFVVVMIHKKINGGKNDGINASRFSAENV